MKKRTLAFQSLEQKRLLAVVGFVDGDTLVVEGDNRDNVIQVDQERFSNNVTLTADGKVESFSGIKEIHVRGNNGDDDITINTYDDPDFLIFARVWGGNGDDIIQGGGGGNFLHGGNGDDIISTFVTDENYNPIGKGVTNILIGGNGNDSLWGGWGVADYIFGGNGNDVIYDIVGGSNYIHGGRGDNFIIARTGAGLPTDPLNNPGELVADTVVSGRDKARVLFDAGTQAGGKPVLIDGTLYVLNLGGGDIEVNQLKNRRENDLLVTYNGVDFSFNSKDVKAIAGIGGPTDDTFINNTGIRSVFYGQGGDDVLLGGGGDDVLKGGDGDDYIDGRGGSDDISGDAGFDTLVSNDGKKDIVRVDINELDQLMADVGKDRLVIKRNLAFA